LTTEHILEAVGREGDKEVIEQDERDRLTYDALFGRQR
jgi:hypothetical protein